MGGAGKDGLQGSGAHQCGGRKGGQAGSQQGDSTTTKSAAQTVTLMANMLFPQYSTAETIAWSISTRRSYGATSGTLTSTSKGSEIMPSTQTVPREHFVLYSILTGAVMQPVTLFIRGLPGTGHIVKSSRHGLHMSISAQITHRSYDISRIGST
ncbi:MAG: hypothetical protein ACOX8S_07895 [Christensenellales bacterium]